MLIDEFKTKCLENGLELTNQQIEQYIVYAKLLKEWNEKMNLTGIVELEEVLEKHFFDSLLISFKTPLKNSLCDIGAGAGFPSIPLKIAYPDLSITIIEPLQKRVKFLNAVIDELKLEKIECICDRAEIAITKYRESFDFVTGRAVANLRVLSELCIPFVKKGGYFIAMKGLNGELEHQEAITAIKTLGCELEELDIQRLSDDSKRVNLYYKKVKACPKIYPRHFSKIKKNPL